MAAVSGTALLLLISSDAVMLGIQRGLAVSTSVMLNLLGHGTVVQGNSVISEAFGISVVTACTGVFIGGLFAMAVLLFPTTWRARIIGLGVGVVGLYVVNLIRLVSLYYVGIHWPGAFDTVHQLVWQSLLIAIAVALWLLWAGKAPRRLRRPS